MPLVVGSAEHKGGIEEVVLVFFLFCFFDKMANYFPKFAFIIILKI